MTYFTTGVVLAILHFYAVTQKTSISAWMLAETQARVLETRVLGFETSRDDIFKVLDSVWVSKIWVLNQNLSRYGAAIPVYWPDVILRLPNLHETTGGGSPCTTHGSRTSPPCTAGTTPGTSSKFMSPVTWHLHVYYCRSDAIHGEKANW